MSLKDLKIQAFTEPVSDLPDNPSQSGITAEELKRRFDANANNELKPSVNGIVDFLLGFTNGEEIKGIRLNSDNVIEVTTDGKNYISTGYSKTYITQLLAEKVDKSDVILKTNTEEFAPTGPYQPATKKYVDDKVVTSGAADMTQAVYDPTGRQTDIFAEVDKKFDKTGGVLSGNLEIKNGYGRFIADGQLVQIEAVNKGSTQSDKRILQISNYADRELSKALKFYDAKNGNTTSYNIFGEHNKDLIAQLFLPLTGGMLTGDLFIKNGGYSRVLLLPNIEGRDDTAYVMLGANKVELATTNSDSTARRGIFVYNSDGYADLKNAIELYNTTEDNDSTYYKIFGEHNKPAGMYTGNGSATERVINTGGIGRLLFLYDENGFGFVTPGGALFFRGTSATRFEQSTICYNNGVLTIKSSDDRFNGSGYNYEYDCL